MSSRIFVVEIAWISSFSVHPLVIVQSIRQQSLWILRMFVCVHDMKDQQNNSSQQINKHLDNSSSIAQSNPIHPQICGYKYVLIEVNSIYQLLFNRNALHTFPFLYQNCRVEWHSNSVIQYLHTKIDKPTHSSIHLEFNECLGINHISTFDACCRTFTFDANLISLYLCSFVYMYNTNT